MNYHKPKINISLDSIYISPLDKHVIYNTNRRKFVFKIGIVYVSYCL